MTELNDRMDRISDTLLTLEQLIASGKLKCIKNKIVGELIVETVYDDEASMVVIEQGKKGQMFPLHTHVGCIQFLICVRGKFSIKVPLDNIARIIKAKDCFTVPADMAHSVHCLEDGSKLIGVVIPAEPMYRIK